MFGHVAWYLFSTRHSHLASSVSGWWLHLFLSSSQNSPHLVTPPILPVWLLANQHSIKPVWVTKSLQCTRAFSPSSTWSQGYSESEEFVAHTRSHRESDTSMVHFHCRNFKTKQHNEAGKEARWVKVPASKPDGLESCYYRLGWFWK